MADNNMFFAFWFLFFVSYFLFTQKPVRRLRQTGFLLKIM